MNSDASAKEKGANYSTIIWFIDFLVVVSSSLIDPAFGIVVNILNSFFLIFHVRFVCVCSHLEEMRLALTKHLKPCN